MTKSFSFLTLTPLLNKLILLIQELFTFLQKLFTNMRLAVLAEIHKHCTYSRFRTRESDKSFFFSLEFFLNFHMVLLKSFSELLWDFYELLEGFSEWL